MTNMTFFDHYHFATSGETSIFATLIEKWAIAEEARQGLWLFRDASKPHQKAFKMPKVKTNSSAKKRFKVTGTGKITHQKSFKRHILTKKSKKRKRNMRKDGEVAKSHMDFVKRLLRLK